MKKQCQLEYKKSMSNWQSIIVNILFISYVTTNRSQEIYFRMLYIFEYCGIKNIYNNLYIQMRYYSFYF